MDKIEIYRNLSKHFSLLPLEYNNLLPVSKKWRSRCFDKVNFVKEEYIDKEGQIRNAGTACGKASKIIVIKRKTTNNFKAWQFLNEMTNPFPETFTVSYGDDIDFFYYQYPQDGKRYETKSCLYDIDILAVNSFVPVYGTIDPQSGLEYAVSNDTAIAMPPQWVIEVLSGKDNFKTLESEADKIIFQYENQFKLLNPEFRRETHSKALQIVQNRIGLVSEDNFNQKELTESAASQPQVIQHTDSIGKFIKHMCDVEESSAVQCSQFNKLYLKWCNENGETVLGKHLITSKMTAEGFVKKKTKGTEHWIGLKINNPV